MRKNIRKSQLLELSGSVAERAKFAGLDYHKLFVMVSIGDEDGEVLLRERIPTDKEALLKFFRQFPSLICVVESCRGYEWFVDFLKNDLRLDVSYVTQRQ